MYFLYTLIYIIKQKRRNKYFSRGAGIFLSSHTPRTWPVFSVSYPKGKNRTLLLYSTAGHRSPLRMRGAEGGRGWGGHSHPSLALHTVENIGEFIKFPQNVFCELGFEPTTLWREAENRITAFLMRLLL